MEPLRAEFVENYEKFERSAKGLPLMDSFINESARLTPVEARKITAFSAPFPTIPFCF